MNYIVLDLEFNGAYSKKKRCFVNEIIEFGAVKCDEQLNIIDNFSALVTPQISKKLNSHVSKLTRLQMSELQESNNTFTHVLSKFKKFLGDGILLSWGSSDILVLMENCKYYFGDDQLPFLNAYANLQHYCEEALDYHDRSRQMGLSTCAEMIGIGYDDGALHRALTDAELTSLCFQKLYKADLFERYVQPCDENFYKRITFKNYNICDPKDPAIDRREFYFNCEHCGKRAWRRSRWNLKNKSFRARFRCIRCHRDFEGRLTFKQCYDSVQVFRRAVDLPLPNKAEQKKPVVPAPAEEKASAVPDTAPRVKPVDEPLEIF